LNDGLRLEQRIEGFERERFVSDVPPKDFTNGFSQGEPGSM
jgi:hypothetical protein